MNAPSCWCPLIRCQSVITLVLSLTQVLHAQVGVEWRLRSPLPTAENLSAAVSTGSLLVAAGDAGTIITSADTGATWTARQVSPNQFQSVAWSGTQLLAACVGSDSTSVWSSPDGLTWTPLTTDFQGQMCYAIWTGTQWAGAVTYPLPGGGDSLSLMTSTDGSHWSLLGTLPDAGQYHSVRGMVWTGARYVLAGEVSFVSAVSWTTSTANGSTWESHSYPDGTGFSSVVWTGSQVVAGGDGRAAVYTSPTGTGGWTTQSPSAAYDTLLWTGSQLVALASNSIQTSTDGVTWTAQTVTLPDLFYTLAAVWTGGQALCTGYGGHVFTSPDGITWTSATPAGNTSDLYAAASNGSGVTVAVGQNGTALQTTDGTTWTAGTGGTTSQNLYGVTWAGAQFVAVGGDPNGVNAPAVQTSADGSVWVSTGTTSFSTTETLYAVAASAGMLVAVGVDQALGQNGVLATSTDGGVTWTHAAVPASVISLNDINPKGTLWVAVGTSSSLSAVVMTSADGMTWTQRAVPASAGELTGVASSGTTLVAVGSSLLSSTNGTTWTLRQQTTNAGHVAWTGSDFVSVDRQGGGTSTSLDGITWTSHPSGTNNSLNGLAWDGTQILAVGTSGVILSSDTIPTATMAQTVQSGVGGSVVAVTVQLSFPAPGPVSVPIIIGGNAQPSYYSGVPATVSFAKGESSQTFLVSVTNGFGTPGVATLTLGLGPSTTARTGSNSSTTLSLIGNDGTPPVSFAQAAMTVPDNVGTVGVAVDLGWAWPSTPVTVPVTVSGPAAAVCSGIPASLSFPLGVTSQTISISVADDSLITTDQTLTLTLGTPTNGTLGSLPSFTLTIKSHHPGTDVARQWTLRNPLPAAEGLESLATTGPWQVIVGGKGLILFSTDAGATWTRSFSDAPDSGGIGDLHKVIWTGSQFLAVGDGGQILTSADGIAWVRRLIPGAGSISLHSVAWSGSLGITCGWVTGTENPVVYSSTDGIVWMPQSLPPGTTGEATSVVWSGSAFIIVGADYGPDATTGARSALASLILTSPDGYAWANQSSAVIPSPQGGFKNVIVAGSQVVAFDGSSTAWTSPAGSTWTARKLGTLGGAINGVYVGGQILAVGGALSTSPDGSKWTQRASPAKVTLTDVAWTGGNYITIGGDSSILTSPDGKTWPPSSSGVDSSGAPLIGVVWSGSQFVAVGGDPSGLSSALVMTSPDGTTWTQRSTPVKAALTGVAWSGSTFVATGLSGVILTSPDGITWTKRTSGTVLDLRSVIWADGQFVVVGGNDENEDFDGQVSGSLVLTSPNGTTWTLRTLPTNRTLQGIAFNGSTLVATGRKGELLTSPDGIAWTHQNSGITTSDLHDVTSSGKLFVASGDGGAILRSADGITWTPASSVPVSRSVSRSTAGVVWAGDRFVTVGDKGSVLSSSDADVWTEQDAGTHNTLNRLAWNGTVLVAVGDNAAVLTSTGPTTVPTVQLASSNPTTVSEAAGTLRLLVQLSSPTTSTFSVPFTFGGSAQRTGLLANVTVPASPLVFNAGETGKVITVAIKNNTLASSGTTLSITLGAPTSGAMLGTNITQTVTITDDDIAPFCTQPPHQLLALGAPLILSTTGSGSGLLTYQWKKNGATIAGATLPTYYLPAVTLASAGTYTVTVQNYVTSFTSTGIEVGVYDGGTYSYAPATGGKQVLTQTTAGNGLSITWTKGGTTLGDATGHIAGSATKALTITGLTDAADTGLYRGVVTQAASSLVDNAGVFNLAVAGAKPTLAASISLPAGVVGQPYDYHTTLLDNASAPAASFSASGLPAGLNFNTATGAISGSPTAVAAGKIVTFTATNALGASTGRTAAITVTALPPGLAGTWDGVTQYRGTLLDGGLGARVGLTVSSAGAFTGKVTIGTVVSSFLGGQLNVSGSTAAGSVDLVQPGNRVLRLAFTLDPTQFNVGGTLSLVSPAGSVVEAINFDLVRAKTTDAANYQGVYSFALDLDASFAGNPAIPQGTGFGTINATPAGTYTLGGRLADGTAFTCASFVGGINYTPSQLLIYAPLYGGKGSLHGGCNVSYGGAAPAYADSVVVPLSYIAITWSKPVDTTAVGARTYPQGWQPVTLHIDGSKYNPPALLDPPMGLDGSTIPNASLGFTQGGVDLAQLSPDNSLWVRAVGSPLPTDVNPSHTTLAITRGTGAFSGAFTLADIMPNGVQLLRPVSYQGQIVRTISNGVSTYRGVGWFLLPQLPPGNVSPMPLPTTTPILSGQVQLLALP